MTVQNYVPTVLRIPKYKFKFRERTAFENGSEELFEKYYLLLQSRHKNTHKLTYKLTRTHRRPTQ
jgi:hypothetical protein